MEEIQIPYATNYYCRRDGTVFNNKTGNICKGAKHGNGYLTIYLRLNDGSRKKFFMHRLIAEAFCEKHEGCDFVDHINGYRNDNRAENLQWVTASENTQRGYDQFNYRKFVRTDYSYQILT